MYSKYLPAVQRVLDSNDLSAFKHDSDYKTVLEHVTPALGQEYFDLIRDRYGLPVEDIRQFCDLNDGIGAPNKTDISGLSVSPTSLRYIFQALKLLDYCTQQQLQDVRIVELGGGYGGLALAVNIFQQWMRVTVCDYALIDLPAPLALQEKYLAKFDLAFKPTFHSADKFGADLPETDYFLTSHYCFSELEEDLRSKYAAQLLPKCAYGFLTWNIRPLYDFGKTYRSEIEYPCTDTRASGVYSYYVYFAPNDT